MTKQLLAIGLSLAAGLFWAAGVLAQTSRARVSVAEVNGTFRLNYSGRFKGSYNEIKVLALGGGRLKMEFGLTYPHVDGTGSLGANVGEDRGTAEIAGDRAVFTSETEPECKIEVKFVRPGTINVKHLTEPSSCGYGLNVTAEGIYRKVSGKKPAIR